MGYSMHIEREGGFTADEWLMAVDATDGVRPATRSMVRGANPRTGAVIEVGVASGAAEVYRGELDGWHIAFHHSNGRASFQAPYQEWTEPTCFIREVAFRLAALLSAEVVGDEGEIYGPDGCIVEPRPESA